MPQTTPLELLAPAAREGEGTSAAVETGGYLLVRAHLEIAARDDGAELDVIVETSRTGATWRLLAAVTEVATTGTQALVCLDADRYVRARWGIAGGGGGPSVTFGLDGDAIQLYATAAALRAYLRPDVVGQATADDLARELAAATDRAAGALASPRGPGHAMPLTSWGDDIARAVTDIAGYAVMSAYGYRPDAEDNTYRQRYEDAIAWLDAIASGDVEPAPVVDAGTRAARAQETFTSQPSRGWARGRRTCDDGDGIDEDGFPCPDELAP